MAHRAQVNATATSCGVLNGTYQGHGTLVDGQMDLVATSVGRTATGMCVVGVERRYRIDGDEITYELDMATETTPMIRHLSGRLRRANG